MGGFRVSGVISKLCPLRRAFFFLGELIMWQLYLFLGLIMCAVAWEWAARDYNRQLFPESHKTPLWCDIVGGAGFILALMGLFMWGLK